MNHATRNPRIDPTTCQHPTRDRSGPMRDARGYFERCLRCRSLRRASGSVHSTCGPWIPPTPPSKRAEPRHAVQVPHTEAELERWEAEAERQGLSLGEITRRALNAFTQLKGPLPKRS